MRDACRIACLMLLASGCVLPSNSATGLEMSWHFRERNVVDGEDRTRVRTCEGAAISTVRYRITDTRNPARSGSFEFACEEGFKTESQFQTEASSAFIELRPGPYVVAVTGIGEAGTEESLQSSELSVNANAVTTELFTLSRAPVPWTFELTGVSDCETFGLALEYAEPEDDLAESGSTTSGTEEGEASGSDEDSDSEESSSDGFLYRGQLASDRGLVLDGSEIACTDAPTGVHLVDGVDVGRYRLVRTRDGEACSQTLTIGSETPVTTISLAEGCES